MTKFDVSIIGNGVLALSTAYSLLEKDKNLKINIIGPACNVGSATIAAGAMINCFAEITNRTFKTQANKKKFEMAYKAAKKWDEWLVKLNEDILEENNKIKLQSGTYVILNSESGKLDSDNYYEMKQALINYNEPFDEINDIKEIPGINPVPNYRPLCGMFIPNESSIDSNFYLMQLKNILLKNPNITFTDGFVRKILNNSNNITSLILDTGESVTSSSFILANGAYAQDLIDQIPLLQQTIPHILAGVGFSVLLEQDESNPINHVIRTPNRAGACGLHALPRKNSLYVGATNNVFMSPKEKLTTGLTKFLLNCATEQLNQNLYTSNIEGYHVGNRPVSLDGFPLIGKSIFNNLWVLNGTYRDGFHQSPLIAEEISKEILSGTPMQDNIFIPNRKLIKTMTREESIEEFLVHYVAGTFEHSAKLPSFMPVDEFTKLIRTKITNIYDKLDTDYGLNPEILIMIDFARDQDKMIEFFKNYLKRSV